MPVATKKSRRPTVTVALGRQRVGKTAVLNTMAQFYRARGCPVRVWNADQQNQSHTLSTFFPDAKTVPTSGLDDGKAWIEARFEELMSEGGDAILDVGGGATAFARLAAEIPLLEMSEQSGLLVVGVFVTGPDPADLDYLEQFASSGSLPKATIVVANAGLVSSERAVSAAFEIVFQHRAVDRVLMNGGFVTTFPALTCMTRTSNLGVSFEAVLNGGSRDGLPPLGMFDRMRVNRWWTEEVPAFFAGLPQEWLPLEARQVSEPVVSREPGREPPAAIAAAAE